MEPCKEMPLSQMGIFMSVGNAYNYEVVKLGKNPCYQSCWVSLSRVFVRWKGTTLDRSV